MLEGNDIYAVSTDWRGLPQQVTDNNQQTVWAREFDAWGNFTPKKILKTPQRIKDLNIRLAGQYYDDETGLHYNIHRYFNPQTGRYISPDPLGTPDGSERYAYLNGNPHAGVDPLGLFEVPLGALFGNVKPSGKPDGGHGDIIRIAFAQYNAENGMRFSQTIIDQIITNTYHTDALPSIPGSDVGIPGLLEALGVNVYNGIAGGGQFSTTSHFDNPNDGPLYDLKGNKTETYTNDAKDGSNWIQDALTQVNNNRGLYNDVKAYATPAAGYTKFSYDISTILNAFGQNAHALADFYAHTNWVDAEKRGGCVHNKYAPITTETGEAYYPPAETGYVPIGLAQTTVWDEKVNDKIYSGTVGLVSETCLKTDIFCDDKTTHGYWNKDHDKPQTDDPKITDKYATELAKDRKLFNWSVEVYDPKNTAYTEGELGTDYLTDTGKPPKAGERIYVRTLIENYHQLAFQLAIQHTIQEIGMLYDKTKNTQFPTNVIAGTQAVTLHEVFTLDESKLLDKTILDGQTIQYEELHDKGLAGGIQ